jgi:hypothetical protein
VEINEPRSVTEALIGTHAENWLLAMKEELTNLEENEMWDLVKRPTNQKVIGCKWLYALKKNELGEVVKFKSRVVALGYHQSYGVNFQETYSPVMRKQSLRIFFVIAAQKGWSLHQIDVTAAYLNSPTGETVYMEQPVLGTGEGKSDLVCKLKKSIYGLHHAGRDWNEYLTKLILELGMKQSMSDPCVFYKDKLWIAVHVNDIVLMGDET